ncbi:hypothetical protein [Vibrio breoganii]|uniref:hypothetical protein n=1 Tax=Vibrio breoganii TaxID=553239 RepID=UPI00105603E4|nr:hypothetical protein [Vibrio breoganii]
MRSGDSNIVDTFYFYASKAEATSLWNELKTKAGGEQHLLDCDTADMSRIQAGTSDPDSYHVIDEEGNTGSSLPSPTAIHAAFYWAGDDFTAANVVSADDLNGGIWLSDGVWVKPTATGKTPADFNIDGSGITVTGPNVGGAFNLVSSTEGTKAIHIASQGLVTLDKQVGFVDENKPTTVQIADTGTAGEQFFLHYQNLKGDKVVSAEKTDLDIVILKGTTGNTPAVKGTDYTFPPATKVLTFLKAGTYRIGITYKGEAPLMGSTPTVIAAQA